MLAARGAGDESADRAAVAIDSTLPVTCLAWSDYVGGCTDGFAAKWHAEPGRGSRIWEGASSSSTTSSSSSSSGGSAALRESDTVMGETGYLSLGSWSGAAFVYKVKDTTEGVTAEHVQTVRENTTDELPILSTCFAASAWASDPGDLITAGCCESVKVYRPTESGYRLSTTYHQPDVVKSVKYAEEQNLVVSGSWDGTVRFYDRRVDRSIATLHVSKPCVDLDIVKNTAAFCSSRHVTLIDLEARQVGLTVAAHHRMTQQLRCAALLKDQSAFVAGAIDGRCCVVAFQAADAQSYTFKCHAAGNQSYPVNAVSVHPSQTVFATLGGDGEARLWNHVGRFSFTAPPLPAVPTAFSCGGFNAQGTLFAAVASYDFSKGWHPAETAPAPKLLVSRTPSEKWSDG
ncbi:Protein RAE1 [Diplonema papillatum]|nr:Protein RAE1 [Diplonema papillatum]